MRRIIIAGAGLAGHRAAIALRENGFDGHLTVLGDELHHPYDRPPLSKQLLGGEYSTEQCFFPVGDLDVDWRLGTSAVGLDPRLRTVALSDGTSLDYDGLVIATGRRAREWNLSRGLSGVHTLRSLEDALGFRAAVTPSSRVVIVGAGFIGCEVAATLRKQGVENVTLVNVAPYPMPVLGPEAGARAAALHESNGVTLRMNCGVEALEGVDRVEAVRLTGGERIAADQVLVAVGSMPNSEWLAGSGLLLAEGAVVCDEYCFATGAEDIVVVGDVAAWPHPHADTGASVEHWTNARDMAATAAANLLASVEERKPLSSVPACWSDQYDVKIKTAGFLRAANRYVVVEDDPERPALVVEAYRDEELVGAIVFNRNRSIINYQRRLATVPVA
ncbi:NAD(P)/FAD-dependent oxidoreductase [Nocardia terrae]|nr:FAD/NAD(P)-binding oxidoreductase [Nocardia terrae]